MELKNKSTVASSNCCRPLANYHANVWGDCFLLHAPESSKAYEEQLIEKLKKEVKKELREASQDYKKQLQLIDAIQRLGISYHFDEEIDPALQFLFERFHHYCNHNHDLYSIALSFRLLRQHGYPVSCGIFEKFKNAHSNCKVRNTEEVMGMLEFFEATHLRVHGEDVLDHGFVLSRKYLESALPGLSNPIHEQVRYALNQYSNRRGLPRLEARHYISVYKQNSSHHQGLLRLAKLDFNLLQSLHKRELSELYSLHFQVVEGYRRSKNLPYIRDRMVECYFWILGVYFEPKYSAARKISCKFIALASIFDDTFDAYGTFEELQIFTEAVERWSVSCLNELPDYMKLIYKKTLEAYDEIEEEMIKQGTSFRINYGIEAMKEIARNYYVEAKWREEKYQPTTEEYMRVATRSCAYTSLIIVSFLGMGDVAKREAFDWVLSEPDFVRASLIICRLTDDIVGHEFEQQREHIPSAVECYTEEHEVLKQQAVYEFNKRIEAAWKDINKGFLQPTEIPVPLLDRILNFTRVIEVMYSKGDWYTNVGPEMQGFIKQLLIDPVPQSF